MSITHCYDPIDWEITYPWDARDDLVRDMAEGDIGVFKVATFLKGPDKYAILQGDQVVWFDSMEEARGALERELRGEEDAAQAKGDDAAEAQEATS